MGNAVSGLVDDDGDRSNLARMLHSVGKGDDADDDDERLAMDCGASTSVGVAKDTGEDNERDHGSEAKHKIFLSHSGAQKSFVADLCADLMGRDRHPFFDKLRCSLPVGKKFPRLIFDAIRQCEVGVVVLSEEFFTRSKWPMLELAAMVEESEKPNAKIKIIPVFYDISRKECMNPNVQLEWTKKYWRKWEKEDKKGRIDVEKWKNALGIFGATTGLEKKNEMLDGELRVEIVEAVCKVVRGETRWDDSRVEGKSRLFKEICKRIYKGVKPMELKGGVHVVGLYGTGGVGKTTACKILCNELSGEYHDKVCHVEFGSAREEELLQKVLGKLSNLKVERFGKLDVEEWHWFLKDHLSGNRVFVALDNVSDESAEQAKSILKAKFGDGSVVLVTARSEDQLRCLGVVKKNCFVMPDLEVEEAKSLFLNRADLKQNDLGAKFVKMCLKRCFFSISSTHAHYHPLALDVLGKAVGDMIRGGNIRSSVLRRIGDFNWSGQEVHPVFSIMRISFDSMREDGKLFFLDIALDMWLDCSSGVVQTSTSLEWMFVVHGKDRYGVEDMLANLKRRSLLESFGADEYGVWKVNMHDLWREFAKEEIKVGKFSDRRWVYKSEKFNNSDGEEHMERVDLREHPKLEVVRIDCHQKDVEAVDVRGLKHLKSIKIQISYGVAKQVIGLGTLERLTYLVLRNAASSECIAELRLLSDLKYVDLSHFRGDGLPDMSKLTRLQYLHLYRARSLKCINVQNLPELVYLCIDGCDALRSVDISGCRSMRSLMGIGDELCRLEELNISFCPLLPSLEGLWFLMNLRKLNISGCSLIERLDELRHFTKLEVLRARDCGKLAMLPICMLPNLQVLDIESEKVPIGVVEATCFPMLELELEGAKALFLSRADLTANGMSDQFVNTCLSSCYYRMGQSLSSGKKHYHPVALMMLGIEVGDMMRGGKDESAVLSRISDFNLSREIEHPAFSILKWSFDWMRDEAQQLFLDMALDMGSGCPGHGRRTSTSMEWLCMMHGKDRDGVEVLLEYLKRRSLLESFGADADGYWRYYMHDMWREFAKEEIKVGKFGDRRWVSLGEPHKFGRYRRLVSLREPYKFERHHRYKLSAHKEMVDLREYPKLEAVKIKYELDMGVVDMKGVDMEALVMEAVDVRGLQHLKSIKIEISYGVVEQVIGLGTLERLTYLVLWNAASAECIVGLELLTNLQYVDLSHFRGDRLPDMCKLTSLQYLRLYGARSLQCINVQNLSKLTYLCIDGCVALLSVDISGCMSMRSFIDIKDELHDLKELDISFCPLISSLAGLRFLINLRKLNITGCSSIEGWYQLGYPERLEVLIAKDCERLVKAPECILPNLRALDIEPWKVPFGAVKEKCFPQLELKLEEAKALFFNRANLTENDMGDQFVNKCLSSCYFPTGQTLSLDEKHYHPVALTVLGSEVGDMIRGGEDESAVLSRISDSNSSRVIEHPMFPILKWSFDWIRDELQQLFLDIALDMGSRCPGHGRQTSTSMEWLCMVHGIGRDELESMLEYLKRRWLLQSFGVDENGVWKFSMHDLWRKFAEEEMKAREVDVRRLVFDGHEYDSRDTSYGYGYESLDFREYPKLEALRVDSRFTLFRSMDVRGLKHLKSIIFENAFGVIDHVIGLGTLERLIYLVLWKALFIAEVGLLTNLQYVDLSMFRGDSLPDMSKLTSLQSLELRGAWLQCINVQNLPKLTYLCIGGCKALRSVDISGCMSMRSFIDIRDELHDLEELDISFCPLIPSLAGLRFLINLRKLNITGCSSIEGCDELGHLKALEVLKAKDCERLVILPDCMLPNLRVLDIEPWKVPFGAVKEMCFPMLELEFGEAKALFLNFAELSENDMGDQFVNKCLSSCYFSIGQSLSSNGNHYHPLALKVLGIEVGDMIRGGKGESAVLSRISDSNSSREFERPMFSILKWSFDWMRDELQQLFLDIALDMGSGCPGHGRRTSTSMEWLCMVHGKDRDELEAMLEYLKRRWLLQSFGADENGIWKFSMHGLWRKFAEAEMKVRKVGDRRWVYEGDEYDSPDEGNRYGRPKSVDLREYPKLEAVRMDCSLWTLDVRGLKHLKSIKFENDCPNIWEVVGLGTLERLTYLVLWNASCTWSIMELRFLTNLQYVDLSYFEGDKLPDMSKLTSLQSLELYRARYLQCINVQNLPKLTYLCIGGCKALRSVDISGCMSMRSLIGIGDELCHLEEVNISFCPLIPSLEGLKFLINLRTLNITGCSSIEDLGELSYLKGVEELRGRDCVKLAMLPECSLPNLQVLDIESQKVPTGFRIP